MLLKAKFGLAHHNFQLHTPIQLLLAQQSSAHRRGAYRDFQPNLYPIQFIFEHFSLYKEKHFSQSVAVFGKVDHGRPRQSQVQPGTVLKEPIICYIFEKQGHRGYQI